MQSVTDINNKDGRLFSRPAAAGQALVPRVRRLQDLVQVTEVGRGRCSAPQGRRRCLDPRDAAVARLVRCRLRGSGELPSRLM